MKLEQYWLWKDPSMWGLLRWTIRVASGGLEGSLSRSLAREARACLGVAFGQAYPREREAAGLLRWAEETWRRMASAREFKAAGLLDFVRKALDDLAPRTAPLIIGKSPQLLACLVQAYDLGRSKAYPLMILGETGTGKELVADLYAEAGGVKEDRYRKINCGALSEELMFAELFGAAKGSYTGATEDRKGLLMGAELVFLDELNSLPERCQAALLRFVGEKRHPIRPLGKEKDEFSDGTRIISATNRQLGDGADEEGNAVGLPDRRAFRADLYYRLSANLVSLPALRDRREDIPVILTELLPDSTPQQIMELNNAMRTHYWPGNVRELRFAIQQAKQDALCEQIGVADLCTNHALRAAVRSGTSFAARFNVELFQDWININERGRTGLIEHVFPLAPEFRKTLAHWGEYIERMESIQESATLDGSARQWISGWTARVNKDRLNLLFIPALMHIYEQYVEKLKSEEFRNEVREKASRDLHILGYRLPGSLRESGIDSLERFALPKHFADTWESILVITCAAAASDVMGDGWRGPAIEWLVERRRSLAIDILKYVDCDLSDQWIYIDQECLILMNSSSLDEYFDASLKHKRMSGVGFGVNDASEETAEFVDVEVGLPIKFEGSLANYRNRQKFLYWYHELKGKVPEGMTIREVLAGIFEISVASINRAMQAHGQVHPRPKRRKKSAKEDVRTK